MRSIAIWPALCVAGLLIASAWIGQAGLFTACAAGVASGVCLCLVAARQWPRNLEISRPVLLPAGLVIGAHLFAALQSKLPPGVDASFHCTVALHFAATGHVTTDLRPLEDLTLNYPTGSHFLVASLSRLADLAGFQLPPHVAFKLWFPFLVAAATLTVACFEPLLAGGTGAATAWVYAFGLYQISLFPYTWGGLPSLLAMWLVMAGVLYFYLVPTVAGASIAGVLWGAAMLGHHHTAAALIAGLAIVFVLAWKRSPQTARRVLRGGAVAVLASGPYWWRLLSNLSNAGSTGILGYIEPLQLPWTLAWQMGPVFIAGVVLLAVTRLRPGECARFLVALASTWLALFLVLDYGARMASAWLFGRAVTPFTPSRFLFDLQWALCPLLGAAFSRLSAGRRLLVLSLVCLATGVTFTWERWTAVPLAALPRWIAEGRVRREEGTITREDLVLEPAAYVARVAPDRTVVLGTPGQVWLTYCTQRESTCLFIPISEPISDRIRLKWQMLRDPTARPWHEWSQTLGNVPIWAILPIHVRLPGEQILRVQQPLKVVRLWPRVERDPTAGPRSNATRASTP